MRALSGGEPADAAVAGAPARGIYDIRPVIVAGGLLAVFSVLAARAVILGADGASGVRPAATVQAMTDAPRRGDLVDRRGEILATTLTTPSVYADPAFVWDAVETAAQLTLVLPDLNEAAVAERLAGDRRFVWIKRGLTPAQRDRVFALGLPGVEFADEAKRVYPKGRLAAHILGATDVDGWGVSGLEAAAEADLAAGHDVSLTLDAGVQHALTQELSRAVDRHDAQAAVGVVMAANTGAVLAMASLPDFDANAPGRTEGPARRNRASADVYELGSVFKALTFAMIFDLDWAGLDDPAEAGPLETPGGVIRDFSPVRGALTVRQALVTSSNTASARLALSVPVDLHQSYLRAFGLFDAADLDIVESARPLIPARWGEAERATIAFGHGLAVSPVAFTAAFASVVNGGVRVRPHLIARGPSAETPASEHVISPEASAVLRAVLRDVVREGTGTQAAVAGYDVIGKTGTAEKAVRGGYDGDKHITSFAGAFPAAAPAVIVFVMLDEPAHGDAPGERPLAGSTAAPLAARVITRIGPMLGLAPDRAADDQTGAM